MSTAELELLAARTKAFFAKASVTDIGHALIQLGAEPGLQNGKIQNTILRMAEERLAAIRLGLGAHR